MRMVSASNREITPAARLMGNTHSRASSPLSRSCISDNPPTVAPWVAATIATRGTLPYSASIPVTRVMPLPRTMFSATRNATGTRMVSEVLAGSRSQRRMVRAVSVTVCESRARGDHSAGLRGAAGIGCAGAEDISPVSGVISSSFRPASTA